MLCKFVLIYFLTSHDSARGRAYKPLDRGHEAISRALPIGPTTFVKEQNKDQWRALCLMCGPSGINWSNVVSDESLVWRVVNTTVDLF